MKLIKRIIKFILYRNKKSVKQFKSYGMNSRIPKKSILGNPECFSIGDNSIIDTGANNNGAKLCAFNNWYGQKLNPEIIIGNNVYIGSDFTLYCANKVIIEDNVLIASNVFISDNNHGINPNLDYKEQPLLIKSVKIGKGAWIGEKVCVLAGAEIGEKSIIGANSIVTNNIPSYSIAVGSPAKVIKKWDFNGNKWVSV